MTHPLDGADAKLDWAVKHLGTLHGAQQAFLESEPYGIEVNYEPDAGCHVARLQIRDTLSDRLDLVVGDMLHNVRSALDHTAWQLARQRFSEKALMKERTNIRFPICLSRKEFAGDPFLDFITERAATILDALQPYTRTNDPRSDWLPHLNRLWNADKHRTLHHGFLAFDMRRIQFVPRALFPEQLEDVRLEMCIEHGGFVEDGTEVAHIHFSRFPEGFADRQYLEHYTAKVDVKEQPPAQIAFGEGDETVSLFGLGDMCAKSRRFLRLIKEGCFGIWQPWSVADSLLGP